MQDIPNQNPNETYNILLKHQWKGQKANQANCITESISLYGHGIYVTESVEFISEYISGYMGGPVAMIDGVALSASSRKAATIDDIATELKSQVNAGNKIYLYELTYHPELPIFSVLDKHFNFVKLEVPEKTDSYWKIRFATIEK